VEKEKSVDIMNLNSTPAQRLAALVANADALMSALKAARTLKLTAWCIGAGAVRSLVWDTLHRTEYRLEDGDVDLVYFDADAPPEQDGVLEDRLRSLMPSLRWEVTNQAHVHHWSEKVLGQSLAPFACLEDGIATWPEFATCVGICLHEDNSIGVIAPHGLDDLFALRVRHNPVSASLATYRARVQSKRFAERWPKLSISDI
jgi:hypothetical protein